MWKNILEPGGTQMTIWGMCIACWIPEATNTHSNYVILIAFLMQQWLHEHYVTCHIHCLPCFSCVQSYDMKTIQ